MTTLNLKLAVQTRDSLGYFLVKQARNANTTSASTNSSQLFLAPPAASSRRLLSIFSASPGPADYSIWTAYAAPSAPTTTTNDLIT